MTAPRRFAAVLLVAGLQGACSGDSSTGIGSDVGSVTSSASASDGPAFGPDGTSPDDSVAGSSTGMQPEGFTTVTARITEADGEVCEVCLWLADSTEERGRGLMGVTDLGDAAGMAFEYEEAVSGRFLMYGTPTPLAIAWFAPDGSVVGTAEMAPCLDASYDDCPRYAPETPYDLAIEVFDDGRGDALAALGIGPGSRLELVPGTEAERCVP